VYVSGRRRRAIAVGGKLECLDRQAAVNAVGKAEESSGRIGFARPWMFHR